MGEVTVAAGPKNPAVWSSLRSLLRGYDLEELTDWAYQKFVEGASTDEIMLDLENQPTYKSKFKAIFERRDKGLPPVTVNDLVNYRKQALELERFYGLPEGFISGWDAVNSAVTADVSVNELHDRVKLAAVDVVNQPPEVMQFFKDAYGVDQGGMLAYFADPNRALPLLERQVTSAQIAGQATHQGFGALSRQEAEALQKQGVTADQAQQGFGQLARSSQLFTGLPGTNEGDMARETILGSLTSTADQVKLAQRARERKAQFEDGGRQAGGLASGVAR